MELKKFKLRFHPLFFAVGIISAFTGGLLLFLIAVFAALEHECAHAFAARRYGYSLDTIVLMPYGAVVSGDLSDMGRRQSLWVFAAGPLSNAATALLFVALWWLFPETYAFTDTAAYLSFSLFAVNLLPAYPLDGGRILRLLLAPIGESRARAVCAAVSFLTAAAVAGCFVYSCFSSPAFTALFFSLLLFAGAAESLRGGGRYGRISFSREKSFLRGLEERRIVISAERTLGYAMRYLCREKYLVLVLFQNGEFCGELTEGEYLAALESGDYEKSLSDFLPRF
ncbi:MAG: site-2 protease family protein [Clostridia bacterium]|nr:site-2 protease family protein [Clostridia bacterium]